MSRQQQEREVVCMLERSRELRRDLEVVRSLGLPHVCIAAGYVRNAVWDELHHYRERTPLNDVDVLYYDPTHCDERYEKELESRLRSLVGAYAWSVKNQARMHERNGSPPYRSVEDAMMRWPETATAVGATLAEDGNVRIVCPLGLDDLLGLIVRRSPYFQDRVYFLERVRRKNWLSIWPRLRLTSEGGSGVNRIQAVLFDLDNTLLDRTQTFSLFTDAFLKRYFTHMDSVEHLHRRIVELDEDGYKDKQQLFAELLEELPWEVKPEHAELYAFYNEHYVANAIFMEQAKELIHYVRGKYKTGLITNGRTAIQYGKIDRLGIRNDFDVILVSEEAGVKKPDARIFQMALDRLQIPAENALYIGDHPENDIGGAAACGMSSIWLQVNQPWNDSIQVQPAHMIRKLEELFRLI